MHGFSNNRTVENLISYSLFSNSKKHFNFFYPLFFINRRDNTKLAKAIEEDDLKVIAVFSRRPKVNEIDSDILSISFHPSMLFQIEALQNLGIPTFVGFPACSSLTGLSFGSEVTWLRLSKEAIPVDLIYKKTDHDNCICSNLNQAPGINSITTSNLIDVMHRQESMTWSEILKLIEKWYEIYKNPSISEGNNTFYLSNFFMSIQRPLFIIYRSKSSSEHK